jgi:hypothetical protein
VFGEGAIFIATVAVAAPGTGLPAGTVTFLDGGTPLGTVAVDADGRATFNTAALGVGSHNITAAYNAGPNFAGSTSPVLVHVVNPVATTTTLVSSRNPSVPGQQVTLTATVLTALGGGVPAGTVTFLDGTAVLGTVGLNAAGQASLTVAFAGGSHPLTAVYSGTASFGGSTSAVLNQLVGDFAATTTLLGSSANPANAGQAVTFSATVSPTAAGLPVPTGTVTFRDGTTALATVDLDAAGNASFTTSTLEVGDHPITATYSGDSTFAVSTSQVLTQVITNLNPTTTTLLSLRNPSQVGQTVSFVALVGANGTPTGTVTFRDGNTVLATLPLTGTIVLFTTSFQTEGAHTITATYNGDGTFGTSSASVIQNVTPAGNSPRATGGGGGGQSAVPDGGKDVAPLLASGSPALTEPGTSEAPPSEGDAPASPLDVAGVDGFFASGLGSEGLGDEEGAPAGADAAGDDGPALPFAAEDDWFPALV